MNVAICQTLLQRSFRLDIKTHGLDGSVFSSSASDFNDDFGLTTDEGETSVSTFLDLTPLGRQEKREDSPDGWPQTPPYEWWRRHDEYDK